MRILFISSTRLGDAILSSGALDWLLRRTSDAHVTVACGPVAAELFQSVPEVRRVIPMRKGPWQAQWRGLWLETVGTRWDLVVDLRGSAFAWTVRSRERRVFRTPSGAGHRVDQIRDGLRLDGETEPRLWIGDPDRRRAHEILGDERSPVLALAPTANWPPKAWAAERFVALFEMLTGPEGALPGARILVAGGPGERALAQPVLDAVPAARRLDLVGTQPLMTLAACLERCRLVVANDSGLMHLAASAGAPVLGLFGPSDERHYAPRGPRAAWVRSDETSAALLSRSGQVNDAPAALMAGLPVGRVVDAVGALLARTG
ncbi:glycosyltransferase family 9 protein [Thalassobaculum sp.]|uniref:glycosyltransferase family 9 protein n=1 Tax=Thalassobaculum sp. TaxID=2022740 RepID=UPI0032EF2282